MRTCFGLVFGLALAVVASGAPLDVLCTTSIVGDVVRNVALSDATILVLVPIGTDPHAFAASPRDAIAIETADVVFLSGGGLEASLAPLFQTAGGRAVDLSIGLTLRTQAGQGENADEHGAVDPHVWFDPQNVIEWVRVIEQTLTALDPEHAATYAARAAAYAAKLVDLNAWIVARVAVLPIASKRLVTDHASFGYFADRYGFAEIGTVFPSTSTLAEPSARDLALLEDAIRATAVRALFVGTTVSPALAEQIAADTGARVVFLYTGSLSKPDGPAATYVDLMRYDVDAIVAALHTTP